MVPEPFYINKPITLAEYDQEPVREKALPPQQSFPRHLQRPIRTHEVLPPSRACHSGIQNLEGPFEGSCGICCGHRNVIIELLFQIQTRARVIADATSLDLSRSSRRSRPGTEPTACR